VGLVAALLRLKDKEEAMSFQPRMQRVEGDYLHEMLHKYLTDDEWKVLSDKVCLRAYNKQIEQHEAHIKRLLDQGPSL